MNKEKEKILGQSRSRVYYGEYTLKHWIDMILNEKIVLPEYQRSFVWNKAAVLKLYETFDKKYFVPPVTIGKCGDVNIIIDGQQRLTSLILGLFNIFPSEKLVNRNKTEYANENDDLDEYGDYYMWSIRNLTQLIKKNNLNSINAIRDYFNEIFLDDNKEKDYVHLNIDKKYKLDDFYKNNYLGFSYLIPAQNDIKVYFPNTFRNINTYGSPLSLYESRKSLYYLDNQFEEFFNPQFINRITVKNAHGTNGKIDFVRYLSICFQYAKKTDIDSIEKGYAKKAESYYEDFIMSIVDNKSETIFEKYDSSYIEQVDCLEKYICNENYQYFKSIIDADIYLFGLIYYVVLKKQVIDIKDELFDEINNTISKIKDNSESGKKHVKNPALLKHLRKRFRESLKIYSGYITNE